MVTDPPWKPSPRYEGFYVYKNSNGTFQITVVAGDGGYVFADQIQSKEEADWTASLLNAAIGSLAPLNISFNKETI